MAITENIGLLLTTLSQLKDSTELGKDAYALVKKFFGNEEKEDLFKALSQLAIDYNALQKEHDGFFNKNKIIRNNAVWFKIDEKEEGPFCLPCSDAGQRKHLIISEDKCARCTTCHTSVWPYGIPAPEDREYY